MAQRLFSTFRSIAILVKITSMGRSFLEYLDANFTELYNRGFGVSLADVKNDVDIASAIALKHSNSNDHAPGSDNQVIPTTLPASDVFEWAKAATKPSYSVSEIGSDTSKLNATAFDGLSKITVSASPPSTPIAGDIWFPIV